MIARREQWITHAAGLLHHHHVSLLSENPGDSLRRFGVLPPGVELDDLELTRRTNRLRLNARTPQYLGGNQSSGREKRNHGEQQKTGPRAARSGESKPGADPRKHQVQRYKMRQNVELGAEPPSLSYQRAS